MSAEIDTIVYTTIDVSVAADAADDYYVSPPASAVGDKWLFDAAYFIPRTAVSAGATNYATVTLGRLGTTLTSALSTETEALVVGVPNAFAKLTTLTAKAAMEFTFGTHSMLVAVDATPGTGDAVDGQVMVRWIKVR